MRPSPRPVLLHSKTGLIWKVYISNGKILPNSKNNDPLVASDIITQCKQKDEKAFKALYEACLPYVFTIVKGYVDDAGFRKDLVQEIFANVFLNINTYQTTKGAFRYWLRRIAVNQCLMFLRKKKKMLAFEGMENAADTISVQGSMDISNLDPDIPEQILEHMPDGYRQVFSLVILEGYSHTEAGQKLGISAGTSRSQLTRSKRWLQQYFLTNRIR